MGKIARFKEIKIESKRTILVKNFCAFNPKYAIFLCVFRGSRASVGKAARARCLAFARDYPQYKSPSSANETALLWEWEIGRKLPFCALPTFLRRYRFANTTWLSPRYSN
ncbi:hypothetical protein I8748_28325 [Nostoc sp. CENA67]|uniref:Uncharacterized protein n=1 Tax=Amazonocrinis nigriterrae CENA67 TaxID=2794033 RepID=A0A8J7HUJ5_9NOST|nr:hypothetical protein [Amazonocrinis nigriterrae]MBH8566022.1 hypothetical protein [Amazonocrinis nigriterrae CENA67]